METSWEYDYKMLVRISNAANDLLREDGEPESCTPEVAQALLAAMQEYGQPLVLRLPKKVLKILRTNFQKDTHRGG